MATAEDDCFFNNLYPCSEEKASLSQASIVKVVHCKVLTVRKSLEKSKKDEKDRLSKPKQLDIQRTQSFPFFTTASFVGSNVIP